MLIGYRTGDMWAPQLAVTEALSVEAAHFVDCMSRRTDAAHRRRGRPARGPAARSGAPSRWPIRAGSSSLGERGARMIPFVDLQAQYRALKPEIDAAVLRRARERASSSSGRRSRPSSRSSPPTAGTTEAVGVNSGTSALHLALLAAGVGPGDEVITVPNTFVATVAAIEYTRRDAGVRGRRARLLDDGSGADRGARSRRGRRRSCRCTSTASPPTWIRSSTIARRHGLTVIEDACQAHGAEYKGRRCGSLGDLGCFSFYPGKNLGAYGEGGAVVTNDAALARARCACCAPGARKCATSTSTARFNYRMDGVQGAVLGVKLRHLEAWTEARRAPRRRIRPPARGHAGVAAPVERPGARHVYHVYVGPAAAARRLARAAAPRRACRPACTTRFRCTCSRPIATSATTPATFPVSERAAGRGAVAADVPRADRRADRRGGGAAARRRAGWRRRPDR